MPSTSAGCQTESGTAITLYVSDYGYAGTVSAYRPGETAPFRTITTGGFPTSGAVGTEGSLYVVNTDENSSVVKPGDAWVHRIIQAGQHPVKVALATDGTAYATNELAGTVTVIPAGAPSPSHTIVVGAKSHPHGIAAAPHRTVYVTNSRGFPQCGDELFPMCAAVLGDPHWRPCPPAHCEPGKSRGSCKRLQG